MEWLYGIGITTIVALQAWILIEIISLKVKTASYDLQMGRLVSDAESEKETRKRSNERIDLRFNEFDQRLRAVESRHQ